MSEQKPVHDPASNGSLPGALEAFMRSVMMEMEDMLPAEVVAYDDATNRAEIRPLVMLGLQDGTKLSRASVRNIPVFRFGGGGFFMRFPIKPRDFGWLKANDRDISLIFQRGGREDWPNTERLHSFSDAMFFPDTMRDWVINGGNADALVIQSMDGSVCMALHDGKITTDAPLWEINVPETVWNGNVTHNGNLSRTGEGTSTGTMNHEGTFILDGTEINNHDHGGVQPGGSRTDPFGQ